MPKKQSLFPVEYDEISLVDSGASQEADVLIFKRDGSITKARVPGSVPSAGVKGPGGPKKAATPSMSKPCATGTNSTGKKIGGASGASARGKNWAPGKHPRNAKGQMAPTSAKSKQKFGKGGTTKAKLNAACKNKSVKKSFSFSTWDTDTLLREKIERKATR